MDAAVAELEHAWRRRVHPAWLSVPVLLAGAAVAAVVATRRPPPPSFEVHASQNLTNDPGCEEAPVFTPDGREVLFDGEVNGDLEILATSADGRKRRQLTHSPGWDLYPEVSPDGMRVAYIHHGDAAGEIRIVGIAGDVVAPPQTIKGSAGAPAWSHDGALLYGDLGGTTWRLSPDGVRTKVTQLPPGHLTHGIAEFPDGELLVSMRTRDQSSSKLVIAHARRGQAAEAYVPAWETIDTSVLRIDRAGRGAYYLAPTPSGEVHLHWRARNGGTPIVLEGMKSFENGFAVAPSGKQLVMSTCVSKRMFGTLGTHGFVPLDRVNQDWSPSSFAAISDDALLITAFRVGDSAPRIWKLSPSGQDLIAESAKQPTVSPDRRLYAWSAIAPAAGGIYVRSATGGDARRLTDQIDDDNPRFSHDSTRVLFTRDGRVYAVPVAGGAATPITSTGVVAFALAPERDLLAVIFSDHNRRLPRVGPVAGPLQDVSAAERGYDEIMFWGANLVLATPSALYELDPVRGERELWSSSVLSLTQVAPAGPDAEPWALIDIYVGDLVMIDGAFP